MDKIKRLTFILAVLFVYSGAGYCQENDGPATSDREFEIDEVNVRFRGTETFGEDEVKSITFTASADYFNEEEFLNDIQRIKKFYFDRGFFKASIDTSTSLSEDKELTINFIITENRRTLINNVAYVGVDDVTPEAKDLIYKNDPAVKAGSPYSKENVSVEVFRVLSILYSKGYAFAERGEIEVEELISSDTSRQNKVNIRLHFTPGEIYKFGKTEILVQDKKYNFSESDVRREIQYKEGETYDKDKLLKTENRIASISLIETSRFEITYIDSANRSIDYLIKINLRNKYELTPEVLAYEIDNRFYGGLGLSFSDRYFFGGGRTFNTRIRGLMNTFKNSRFEFLAQVTQPYLFNNENINGSERIGAVYDIDEEFTTLKLSNIISLSYELPPYTYFRRIIAQWEIDHRRIESKLRRVFPGTSDTVNPFSTNIFLSELGFSTLHDNTDNTTFPTRGFFQSFGVEESGGLGTLLEELFGTFTFKYVKFTTLNKMFFDLSDKPISPSVLATKFLAGYIYEYGENTLRVDGVDLTSSVFPFDIKYTAGGSTSNRGWPSRRLGFVPDQDIGGNFLLEGSIEHRLRPFLGSKGLIHDLGFVTFTDFGNVWEDVKDFRLNRVAVSVGAGIRYFTIVGAVRFDVGFKLYDPNPGPVGGAKWIFDSGAKFNDKYSFQFGIGNTF
jgi:outer membrane protein assembly factor BamA